MFKVKKKRDGSERLLSVDGEGVHSSASAAAGRREPLRNAQDTRQRPEGHLAKLKAAF